MPSREFKLGLIVLLIILLGQLFATYLENSNAIL